MQQIVSVQFRNVHGLAGVFMDGYVWHSTILEYVLNL